MKKMFQMLCVFFSVVLMACSKADGESVEPDLYQNVPNSPVPAALTGGLWFWGTLSPVSYYDRNGHNLGSDWEAGREYKFYNENGKGRMVFWQYLGTRTSSSCTTEVFTYQEGSVVFNGGQFTFYPVKGHFKTIKKGCSSGDGTTERKAVASDLMPQTYRWEIREFNNAPALYVFEEQDVNHGDPLFVYTHAE